MGPQGSPTTRVVPSAAMIGAKTRPRAVLFDMDGVLVDSYDAWFALLNQAARAFGCAEVSAEAFVPTWGQGLGADIEVFFPGCSEEVLRDYYDRHLGEHLDLVKVDPSGAPLFARLRTLGIATAVVTNTPTRAAMAVLARAGIDPDVVVGAGDTAEAKPAPDMVLLACRRLGVGTSDAVMVGDSEFDRLAAKAAGVAFIPFGGPDEGALEALAGLPTRIGLG